jgi:ribosome biogenesis protein BRX1
MTETKKWTDRERVLLLCSRGSLARTRHLINDLKRLMPHVRSEAKFDKKSKLEDLNEMCELANCTKCLYFESRKGRDTYLWVSNVDGGPSLKFLMRNIHTMNELNLVGNCLKGSRPILSFDAAFDQAPHFKLIKELLVNVCNDFKIRCNI